MFGVRKWWSFFLKGSAIGQVMGWAKSCCCVLELNVISTERELTYEYLFRRLQILFSHVDPRLTH
jgi:hypothetical protein